MSGRIIEGPYLADVLEQPKALQNTEQALAIPPGLESLTGRLHQGELTQVVLTGMGSSFHALHPLHLDLIGRGLASHKVETSELLLDQYPLLKAGTLLIVVSQSGASVEIVRLLDMMPRGVELIAITNTAQSPLASRATVSLFTQAGLESTVSCKTYLATLMAVSWLSGILCGVDRTALRKDLQLAAPAVSLYLTEWRRHVESLMTELVGARSLFLTGRGASLAAAAVGGLIIKESAHFHAEGMSSAAFRHGPFEMLSSDVFVAVFLGNARAAALNRRLSDDIIGAGGRSRLIGPGEWGGAFCLPEAPERLRPITEMLPVEMISFALAALKGREAGKFERASKITTVE
ncbi:MAG TPA: SIS domain-containing protein [Candidatus Paceibacterota bacterium]|nr:SIS domain-containing protein [Verrucomicrobiota bacterium]HRY47564.1 SIS domain-containing protein [Candidatus Paceibacterota bacterium]